MEVTAIAILAIFLLGTMYRLDILTDRVSKLENENGKFIIKP